MSESHVLLSEHSDTGVPLQAEIDKIPGKPFGLLAGNYLTLGHAIVSCRRPECSWADWVEMNSVLSGFVDPSYPSWITEVVGDNPEDTTEYLTRKLVATEGPAGTAWNREAPE